MAVKKAKFTVDQLQAVLMGLANNPSDIDQLHVRFQKTNGLYVTTLRTTRESDEAFENFKASQVEPSDTPELTEN